MVGKTTQEQETIIETPGEALRAGREARRWSIEQVAQSLNMSVDQVEAIERDDTDQLPGVTYVRGYWSNYANLLEIDIEASVAAYKPQLLDPPSLMRDPQLQSLFSEKEKKRRYIVPLFVLLALIVVGGIYWMQRDSDHDVQPLYVDTNADESVNDIDVRQADTAVQETTTGVAADDSLHDGNRLSNTESTVISTVDAENIKVIEVAEQVLIDRVTEVLKSSTQSGAIVSEAVVLVDEPVEAAVDEPLSDQANTQIATDATANTNELTLEEALFQDDATFELSEDNLPVTAQSFVDETVVGDINTLALKNDRSAWMDVRDVTGEILIYRDVAPAETIILKGTPPFYIFATEAATLEISYQGKAYPFAKRVTGNRLRLKMEADDEF